MASPWTSTSTRRRSSCSRGRFATSRPPSGTSARCPIARAVGRAFTAVAIAATLRAGDDAVGWLAVLVVASLRSPFLPTGYAAFPPLWLLALLLARGASLRWGLAAWLALDVAWPLDWISPTTSALATSSRRPPCSSSPRSRCVARRSLDSLSSERHGVE